MQQKSGKDFIDLNKIDAKELISIVALAKKLKVDGNLDEQNKLLKHKTLAMIFEKTSTRTRISFEVGINQLGGKAIFLDSKNTQLGKGETIEDTAKVLSQYVDAIMIRTDSHDKIVNLAKNASVPVINGLSDDSHPCQIIASILTIEEKLGEIAKKKLAWLGDANNVLNSYIHAAKAFDFELVISTPKSFDFCNEEIKKAQDNGAKITYIEDPKTAAKDVDVIITDTWFSMGDGSDKDEKAKKEKAEILKNYQVNSDLMKLAKPNAIFTHCLPAYRGYEVTSEVIDSDISAVFDEAQNRLHAQKAILLWSMK